MAGDLGRAVIVRKTLKEISRQARVVDQMLTAHATLRDRYARRSNITTLAVLGCSIILCSITFLPDYALAPLGVTATAARALIGGISALIFFLSVLELTVMWGKLSVQHAIAAETLGKLKLEYRVVLSAGKATASKYAQLSSEYAQLMDELPRIPDRKFASLKAYHLRKIRLSQMIDLHVGSPIFLLRLRLACDGLFRSKAEVEK